MTEERERERDVEQESCRNVSMKKPEERDSADMLIVRAESYTAPANRGMGASSRIRCRGLWVC